MLDDYFKANPGVKDLPCAEIKPQSTIPQTAVIPMSSSNKTIKNNFTLDLNRLIIFYAFLSKHWVKGCLSCLGFVL